MKRILILVVILSTIIMSQDIQYVGSTSCKMCHNKEAKGAQIQNGRQAVMPVLLKPSNQKMQAKSQKTKELKLKLGMHLNVYNAIQPDMVMVDMKLEKNHSGLLLQRIRRVPKL